MSSNKPRLCFIGFGEAGQAIASGLHEAGVEQIAAWDILFHDERGAALKQAGEKIGARLASSAAHPQNLRQNADELRAWPGRAIP